MPQYTISEEMYWVVEAHCQGCAMDAHVQGANKFEDSQLYEDGRSISLDYGEEPDDAHDPEEDFWCLRL